MNYQPTVLIGDSLEVLKTLPTESVQTVVTSPPYYNLRDFGVPGQIGLEKTPREYVAKLVQVFREVRRVLRRDGTLWLNLGDTYAHDQKWGGATSGKNLGQKHHQVGLAGGFPMTRERKVSGVASKSLIGIPWRVALAMIDDGWVLRRDIIWHKPNPMPESVDDRPTASHEYIFFFSKSGRYYSNFEAVREPASGNAHSRGKNNNPNNQIALKQVRANSSFKTPQLVEDRNIRSVWTIVKENYSGPHFATFPQKLAENCILAGSKPGDTILDPFAGSGTVGRVAIKHSRRSILIDIDPRSVELIAGRTAEVQMELAV